MISCDRGLVSIVGTPPEILTELDILLDSIAENFVEHGVCKDKSKAMMLLVETMATCFAGTPIPKEYK